MNFKLLVLNFLLVLGIKRSARYELRSSEMMSQNSLSDSDFPSLPQPHISKVDRSTSAERCNKIIHLSKFNRSQSQEDQLFFLETSGKTFLDARQSCSVESAALKSGLVCKVLLKSETLNLSKSESVCELFYNYDNVQFYTIDFGELLKAGLLNFYSVRQKL